MSHTIRRILLLNRGVAIPKMDGGVRPICVSSTLLKIIGVIAMKRDGAPPSAIQMAIGVKEGHVRIAHRVREHVETHESSAVIRVDISNAFGNMPRTLIHSMLQNREETLKQYYRLVYGTDSDIAIYPGNGDKPYIHTSNVGVKQGDSTSSLFFCIALDRALTAIKGIYDNKLIRAEIMAYMDDITVITTDEYADAAAQILIQQ